MAADFKFNYYFKMLCSAKRPQEQRGGWGVSRGVPQPAGSSCPPSPFPRPAPGTASRHWSQLPSPAPDLISARSMPPARDLAVGVVSPGAHLGQGHEGELVHLQQALLALPVLQLPFEDAGGCDRGDAHSCGTASAAHGQPSGTRQPAPRKPRSSQVTADPV